MEILGWRAVFCAGWTKMENKSTLKNKELKEQLRKFEEPGSSIILVQSAKHTWLFPRCRIIVHHGGSGTTAAALRSGVPCLICPVMADQSFWGEHVHQLGCGPRPIAFKDISKETMLKALRAADNPIIQARSKELGRLM